jgi:hypothetical protein
MLRAATLSVLAALTVGVRASHAQTLEDAEMLQRHELHATVMYGHDSWDQYWEGGLKRGNANVGTVSTSSITTTGAFGVNERLTVLAVGAAAAPTSDYTPDFLPMSIGLQSKRLIARAAAHLQDRTGWFLDGYAERQWRSNVRLDRSSYYTSGALTESDEVAMPDVAMYNASVGWQRGAWCIPVGLSAQNTLGGSDIRRQDMPFVSNRMNFTAAHAELMYFLPGVSGLRLDLGAAHTLSGRNVGQSTTIMTGLTYALHL